MKDVRKPDPRGGERARERWEQEVSRKLDNTTFTLDDAFRALLLTTGTTQGQENEALARHNERLMTENRNLRGRITELERKLREVEVVAWL